MVKGIELKVLRVRAGVRQYELAAKLGMNPSRLSLLENGRLPLTQLGSTLTSSLAVNACPLMW